jgi:hypothetical protein
MQRCLMWIVGSSDGRTLLSRKGGEKVGMEGRTRSLKEIAVFIHGTYATVFTGIVVGSTARQEFHFAARCLLVRGSLYDEHGSRCRRPSAGNLASEDKAQGSAQRAATVLNCRLSVAHQAARRRCACWQDFVGLPMEQTCAIDRLLLETLCLTWTNCFRCSTP